MPKIHRFKLRTGIKKKPSDNFSKEFHIQINDLDEKILRAANRLGLDILDNDVVNRLIENYNAEMKDDAAIEDWAMRFFSAAYIQLLTAMDEIAHHKNYGEIISSLCFGNWLVGFLDGMPGTGHHASQCPDCIIKEYLSKDGARKAAIRYADDDKQKEKSFIFERWKEWQIMPKQYKGQAGFARSMIDKCEHLTSTKIVEDWCRAWKVKAKSLTLPA